MGDWLKKNAAVLLVSLLGWTATLAGSAWIAGGEAAELRLQVAENASDLIEAREHIATNAAKAMANAGDIRSLRERQLLLVADVGEISGALRRLEQVAVRLEIVTARQEGRAP